MGSHADHTRNHAESFLLISSFYSLMATVLVDALLPKGDRVTFHQDASSIQERVTGDLKDAPFKCYVRFGFYKPEKTFYSFDDAELVKKDALRCRLLRSRFGLWDKDDNGFVRASLRFYAASEVREVTGQTTPLRVVPDVDPIERFRSKGDFAVASVDTFNEDSQFRVFYLLVRDGATGERFGQTLGKRLMRIDGLTKPSCRQNPRHGFGLHLPAPPQRP